MPGIQILGGGNNISARVSNQGLLQTESVSVNPAHHANLEHENAYVISFTVTPSADSTIFYMRNESEQELIIESATVYSETSDESLCLFANPSGTPSGGDSITPVNSNLGSNKLATGTFQYGANILGLSGGDRIGSAYFLAGTITEYIFRNWIVMPRNTSIMFCADYGSSVLSVTMPVFYYVT